MCSIVTSAFFVGSIFTPWALPVSILPLTVTLIGWFWPKPHPNLRGDQPLVRPVEAEG